MFDNNIGIYVVGKNGAKGRCGPKANWNQPWERPVSMEPVSYTHLDVYKRQVQPWFSGDYLVILHDGKQLRLSRSFREQVLKVFH